MTTEIDRRTLVKGMGAATLGLATGSAAAAPLPKAKRRMVVRADDIGHSVVCNIGTFEAIRGGVISSGDVMLDSPGTEDALAQLRAFPWLSVGWHMHMWGAPVLGAQVPSLVEHGGEFDGRFITDLSRSPNVVYEEALRELNAQLDRCQRILGKLPDTGGSGNPATPWGRAVTKVLADRGIVTNFTATVPLPDYYMKHLDEARARGDEWVKYYPTTPGVAVPADPKWAARKIVTPSGQAAFIDLLTDSISSVEKNYDPVKYYTEDRFGILTMPEDVVTWQAWHPGYVDYYVYRLGERVARARAQQFVVGRTQDSVAMRDPRLKAWIRDNRVALINFRDALYGTNQFQEHLRATGSDLAMA